MSTDKKSILNVNGKVMSVQERVSMNRVLLCQIDAIKQMLQRLEMEVNSINKSLIMGDTYVRDVIDLQFENRNKDFKRNTACSIVDDGVLEMLSDPRKYYSDPDYGTVYDDSFAYILTRDFTFDGDIFMCRSGLMLHLLIDSMLVDTIDGVSASPDDHIDVYESDITFDIGTIVHYPATYHEPEDVDWKSIKEIKVARNNLTFAYLYEKVVKPFMVQEFMQIQRSVQYHLFPDFEV